MKNSVKIIRPIAAAIHELYESFKKERKSYWEDGINTLKLLKATEKELSSESKLTFLNDY